MIVEPDRCVERVPFGMDGETAAAPVAPALHAGRDERVRIDDADPGDLRVQRICRHRDAGLLHAVEVLTVGVKRKRTRAGKACRMGEALSEFEFAACIVKSVEVY